jgi:RNA polymerase sigma factor (sigma-70 family)
MESALVERARRGDREAFGVIAEASMARLFNLAQLMLGDTDLAEDVVQEALIVSWRDLRALRDVERFEPWLTRILVRCVYRATKSERRHVERRDLLPIQDAITPASAADLENRELIDRGFRRIKPEFRAVLVVHHYLGLSDKEAAEILGVPAGTVKSRLHRATAAMRAAIDADTRGAERLVVGAVR